MLVFNLQEPTTVVKDGKPLQLSSAMIKDSTDKMPIIIFESLIKQISEGSCYDMTKMRVQRYLDERTLKVTLNSVVSSNNDIEITINVDNDNVYISPDETKIAAKVVAIDLKTLAQFTYAPILMCQFPLKMDLPGVIIVIMCQHKVHVNQKHIWNYLCLKTMINQNYTLIFFLQ